MNFSFLFEQLDLFSTQSLLPPFFSPCHDAKVSFVCLAHTLCGGLRMPILNQLYEDLKVIFLTETKCKIRFIYVGFNWKRKKVA